MPDLNAEWQESLKKLGYGQGEPAASPPPATAAPTPVTTPAPTAPPKQGLSAEWSASLKKLGYEPPSPAAPPSGAEPPPGATPSPGTAPGAFKGYLGVARMAPAGAPEQPKVLPSEPEALPGGPKTLPEVGKVPSGQPEVPSETPPESQPLLTGPVRRGAVPQPTAAAPAPQPQAEEGFSSAAKNIPEVTRGFFEPIVGSVETVVQGLENLLSLPERLIKHGNVTSGPKSWWGISDKVREAGNAFLKGSQLGIPMSGEEDGYATMPGKIIGGLAGFAPMMFAGGGGAAESFVQKLATNLMTFGLVDSARTTAQGHDPAMMLEAAKGSVPSAVLFTLAQSLPFAKVVSNPYLVRQLEALATGTAMTGASAIGGDRDPISLAVQFGVGYGTHMFGTRGKPEQELARRFVEDFKKKWNLNDEQFQEVLDVYQGKVKEDPNAPPPDPAVSEQVKQNLETISQKYGAGQTPVAKPLSPEQQHEAIFGSVPEGNRGEVVRALMMTEPSLDSKRAERFYDLYEKGDAATAFKEFPELSSLATPQQKAAAITPEHPSVQNNSMGASGNIGTNVEAVKPTEAPTEAKPAIPAGYMGTSAGMAEETATATPTPTVKRDKATGAVKVSKPQDAGVSGPGEALDASKGTAPTVEAKGKEPWEQTKTEFDDALKEKRQSQIEEWNKQGAKGFPPATKINTVAERIALAERAGYELPRDADIVNHLDYHKLNVETALKEGKPVPPEVLADYPDLAAKYGKPAPSDAATKVQQVASENVSAAGGVAEKEAAYAEKYGGPSHAPAEDAELFDRLNSNKDEFNKPRTSKSRKQEIIQEAKDLRRTLGQKGYSPDFIKGVEMGDIGIPIPREPAPAEPATGKGGEGEVLFDRVEKFRSATLGKVHDAETKTAYTMSVRPDNSADGYSIILKGDKGSQSFRMNYRGDMPLADMVKDFQEYLDIDNPGRFKIELAEAKPKEVKPTKEVKEPTQVDEWKEQLAKYKRMRTGPAEKMAEVLERRINADPSKWKEGDGVGWKVAGQTNRGFAIDAIDPKHKMALIRQVADTGLTTSGGDYDKIKPEWVPIGDLVRDNKYNTSKYSVKEGEPGGERLTKEQVQTGFPGAKITESQALKGLYDGFQVDLPNGQRIIVRRDEIIIPDPKSLQKELGPGERIVGEAKRIDRGAMITLAKGQGEATFDHEKFHVAMDMVLSDREKSAVLKKYGTEEAAATAFETWDPKAKPDTLFGKIVDFFRQAYRAMFPDADTVFGKVKEGKVWEREPNERDPLGVRKYRVREEGGDWAMEGGLAGKIKGNVKSAQEEGRAAKNWLTSLFASPRTSEKALKTHQVIAGSQAESFTEKTRMANVFNKYVEKLGPIKGDATQEFLKLYEHGMDDQIKDPVFKAFGEEFRAEERRHMEIMTMLGDAPKEIPNYIDHLWKQNETMEQVKAQLMSQVSGGRSMRGPDYYKLLRTIVDIPSGIAAGYEPKFDTLPEMVLAGRSARENRISATKRINFVEENGYAKTVNSLDGGTFIVESPDGKEETFKDINEARRWAKNNPGSSDPRFESDVPQDWEVYPGGYGEVWAKVKRRAGQMIPERADEETLPLGGGPERMGYEDVPGVDAYTRVGYRVGPKDVVRQFNDFLGQGLSGNTAFEIYQNYLHVLRHSQMALSFFHAFAETINSMATHAGEGVWETLGGLFTGDWRRAGGGLKTLAGTPLSIIKDVRLGVSIDKELMKHGIGIPGEKADSKLLEDARTLVGGGYRPRGETELIKILSSHFKEAAKQKGWAIGKRTNEVIRGLSSPTMEVIVPFAKGGSTMFKYLAEVRRWEREHPGQAPTQQELRNISYEVRDLSDAIFGQMARDNVGMNATLKSLLTGVIQFPTWQFGTVKAGGRAILGAKDVVGKVFDMMQGKEIRQLAIKDRMAMQYVAGLIFTVGMTGAIMNYALTGKKPETMADYFFPKTGEVNPNGSDERLQLPSYFKDAMGASHHPFQTIGAKLASPIHILTDLIQNRDYWGNQVYDPNDWAGQRGIDVVKYLAKTTAPFALQSYEQGAKGGPGRFAMSLLGVRPVPREYANSPLANVVDEYNSLMRATTTTKESAELKTIKGDLMKLAREQDEIGFQEKAQEAISDSKLTRAQIKEIVDESQVPAGQTRFYRLPVEWMARAMTQASDYEREQYTPLMLKKIANSKPEILIRNRDALVSLLDDMGIPELPEAIKNLELPEKAGQFDLTGLGIVKPKSETGGMDEIGQVISDILAKHMEALVTEKHKKNAFGGLSSLSRKESDKKKINRYLGI